jgi:hypothetical protein
VTGKGRLVPVASLVPAGVAGLAAVALLGLVQPQSLLAIAVDIAPAVLVLLLGVWRPWTAVVIAGAAPLTAPLIGFSMLTPTLLAVLLLVIALRWRKADPNGRSGALLITLAGFVSLLVGVGFADIPSTPTLGIAEAILYACVLGVAAAIVRPDPRVIALTVAAAGTCISLLALATPALQTARETVVLGQNANGVGHLAALGLVAGLTALPRWRTPGGVAGLAMAVACAGGLLRSGSRGALLVAVGGVAVFLMHRLIARRPATAIATLAGVTGVLYLVTEPLLNVFVEIVGRTGSQAELNTESRTAALFYALDQGMSHPILGVGLGGLADASLSDPGSGLGLRAHNVFAGAFAETGVITLIALVAAVGMAFLRARAHSARVMLPTVTAVAISGLSLEWWGASGTGPLALLVLGSAAGLTGRPRPAASIPTSSVPPFPAKVPVPRGE